MKAFWDNSFYDMRECGLSEEDFAEKAGETIRDDLERIEDAIKDYDLKKALSLISSYKTDY